MILVFDIGTTVLKGALFSEDRGIKGTASRSLTLAQTSRPDYFEAETKFWKTAFREIASELLSGQSDLLRAVAISGNGPTLVPVDKNGQFLSPVMTWMDRRGKEEGATISKIGRFNVDPSFYLPKVLWLANHKPQVYEKSRHFLSCPEAMSFWLTGEAVTIVLGPQLQKFYWNDELLEALNLDKDKFPDFKKPGEIVGLISREGALESGLPEGVPVIASGPDFVISLLGTASVFPGRAFDRSGTSEGINLCTKNLTSDGRLMCYEHIIEPYYNISGIISTTGKAIEWFRNTHHEQKKGFREYYESLDGVPPGSEKLLFLPYLTGERAPLWDTNVRAAFIGLGLNHGSREMGKAVLESIGYAMRDVMEVMTEQGETIEELRITGGPSKSGLWNQIKADIVGKRILVPEFSDSELLGNFILSLKALGDCDDLADTADRIVKIKEIYEPRKKNQSIYNQMFGLYRESYRKLKSIYDSLDEIKE
ncbi:MULTISPECIES: FGGY-family carbohydrate kinase [unclassified Oceanispirochaeta]|uniref:xylulokinase n=1 Tax=unclassified Oceanispirochaeta TaxID=2635722 RepID=UPI000E0965DE|nr:MULTISPECIES: FGGY-family carbohydrate kinase [unclassified Oceanispirochaeta]MBF9018126.1 hypothetical protein [Oceanispirochaeta sp. M2]NPD74590.1 hypothetical protein [Oceanispirochaeta sp. M1]RDG29542.1 hypothetical protein DV872_21040 [Oceanispirochaeta sp. M1]